MEHHKLNDTIKEIDAPDVLLWAVWALQQYAKFTSLERCRERYEPLLLKIINFIESGKHPNLFMHQNGLLYTSGANKAVSWMNAIVDGHPITPRSGYLVEFNALWYNALRFVAEVVDHDEYVAKSESLNALADKTRNSFREMFINEYGYLYDYVTGPYSDYNVRPNMLFAISLDYSPLEKKEAKQVLDYVTRELLTPKGIRSLSPKSGMYNPYYVGNQSQRNYAYHQGAIWPWLMGA